MKEMMELIKSITKTTKLYRQPMRIGEVFEHDGINWLIIGIQNIDITYFQLRISYICQNLNLDFVYQPTSHSRNDNLVEFELRIRTGKEHILESITLGRMFRDKNHNPYQAIEYTDIEIKHTDIVVSFLARPIRPVARKKAKAKLRNEKMKKLKLEIL